MLGDIVKQTVDLFVKECRTPRNKRRLQTTVLNPVIEYMGKRLAPYVISAVAAVATIVALLGLILFWMIQK